MGYIYKTTNTLNNKIYIGKKHSETFVESYYGSGKILKQSIEKHNGTDHLKVEMIESCDDDDIDDREVYWIDYYNKNGYDLYNIASGGTGGNTLKFKTDGERKEIYDRQYQTKLKNGTLKDSDKTKLTKSIAAKKRIDKNPHTLPDNKGRVFSETGYDNMCKAAEKRKGNIKVNNGIIELELRPNDEIPFGFLKGRLPSVIKKLHEASMSPESNRKRSETIKGSKCYTNGTTNKWVKPNEIPPEGFSKGMTKRKQNNEI